MNLREPKAWLALVSAGFVLSLAARDLERTSPGELAAVHQREPDLVARNGCALCHGGWRTDMREACTTCHETIEAQVQAGRGLHGALEPELAGSCARCHSDHHGTPFALVNARSFALAGVEDPDAFPHDRVGFAMGGRHLELACTECHAHAEDEVLPAGAARFGGLRAACVTCHADDTHRPSLGRRCDDCHDQGAWAGAPAFEHPADFPLVGGHAIEDCRTCHAVDGAWSLERWRAGGEAPERRSCADCHGDPHTPGLLDAAADLRGVRAGDTCAACHDAAHGDFRGEAVGAPADLHALTGFPLDAPHAEVACAACHGSGAGAEDRLRAEDLRAPVPHVALPGPEDPFEARFPGRAPEDCAACHGDPHGGQFAREPYLEAGCLACHAPVEFTPHGFGREAHADLHLPLEDAHARADCAACHEDGVDPALPEGVRRFVGTPGTCEACHADAHDGAFEAFAAALAPDPRGECARCHGTATFAEGAQARFDHAAWTPYSLRGAHAQAACESCHPRADRPDERGRSFGRVPAPSGPGHACADCHRDPHGGGFGERAATQGEAEPGCAACHDEVSFRSLPHGFDHARWTGFELGTVHGELDCAACHAPRAVPDADGRTWERARGSSCAACHADPHGGQFDGAGPTDCADCHGTGARGRGFAPDRFDHDRTRFPLDEAHGDLACDACHQPFEHEGRRLTRYRPLGSACSDCHGETRQRVRNRRERNGGGR